ncbi:AzlC family ABC transporter permease [Nocardioides sp. cx-173]|uniref:AzlC family ABC transporter permease n=1 Tax=Nocardioides sp. cx-173 TaxID=2898796 RepID=UPI001E2F20FE|nr:AzlC family ABC transporter permease [Nocardioides sp. cx-173]MCD4525504.1 AzlC family ABC transporter permease [Nocardioides sp. cx-173]UGB42648.1 AzlC family ABC transporter permease [Nocardioides sp. cx-173]
MNEAFRRGVRLGVPFSLAGFLISLSFGVLAVRSGFTPLQAIVMSAVVHAGSAQFAGLSIVDAGGGALPGVLAGSLMNARFLAMGIAIAPSLTGGPLRRAVEAQAVVDPSWALANQGDGTFDRWQLIGSTVPQYVGWVSGTVVGAFAGDLLGDTDRFGLDAIFPTFFAGLLLAELRNPRARPVALTGALIALALVPFTPPGIPILAASAAALVGLRR